MPEPMDLNLGTPRGVVDHFHLLKSSNCLDQNPVLNHCVTVSSPLPPVANLNIKTDEGGSCLALQRLRERLELAALEAEHPRAEQVAALELQEVGL